MARKRANGEGNIRKRKDGRWEGRYTAGHDANRTACHRGTTQQISDVPSILRNIEESQELKAMWDKYRKQFAYAADIEYGRIMAVLKTLTEFN